MYLHFCFFSESLQLSECVRHGVSLLVRDSGGCSVLHIAAQNGHTDLVSYILQQGEDDTLEEFMCQMHVAFKNKSFSLL